MPDVINNLILPVALALSGLSASAEDLEVKASQVQVIERVGYAYALHSNELIYTEHHRERRVNGQTAGAEVTYRNPQGEAFAIKTLDFSESQIMPDFKLQNDANGHEESATRTDNKLNVVFRHPKKKNRLLEMDAIPSKGIIDAGFDRWIEANWEALSNGQSMTRPFLVPSAGRFVDFAIEQTGLEERDGRSVRVITMKPANFLLRLALSPVVVSYRADAPVLIDFKGISNMRDEAGKNYMVRIEFPATEQHANAAGLATDMQP